MNATELERLARDRVADMNTADIVKINRRTHAVRHGLVVCCNYEGDQMGMMPYNAKVSPSLRKDIAIEIARRRAEREANPPEPTESGPDKVARLATERINRIRAREQVRTMVDVTTDTPMKLAKEFA